MGSDVRLTLVSLHFFHVSNFRVRRCANYWLGCSTVILVVFLLSGFGGRLSSLPDLRPSALQSPQRAAIFPPQRSEPPCPPNRRQPRFIVRSPIASVRGSSPGSSCSARWR